MTYRLVLYRVEDEEPRLVRDVSFAGAIHVGDTVLVGPGDDAALEVALVEHRIDAGLTELIMTEDLDEADVPGWLGLGFREERTS